MKKILNKIIITSLILFFLTLAFGFQFFSTKVITIIFLIISVIIIIASTIYIIIADEKDLS